MVEANVGHTDLLVGQAALGRACCDIMLWGIETLPRGPKPMWGILTYWWVRPHWGGLIALHCGGNENAF